jgi:hypothetical protein
LRDGFVCVLFERGAALLELLDAGLKLLDAAQGLKQRGAEFDGAAEGGDEHHRPPANQEGRQPRQSKKLKLHRLVPRSPTPPRPSVRPSVLASEFQGFCGASIGKAGPRVNRAHPIALV